MVSLLARFITSCNNTLINSCLQKKTGKGNKKSRFQESNRKLFGGVFNVNVDNARITIFG
jgi:hypothetical protein